MVKALVLGVVLVACVALAVWYAVHDSRKPWWQ